jgi:hypothetical protein
MSPVGDAFTVGIVLLLLIGAVAFYLYTRLTQVEKRMGVLEGILLDLKVATENSFMGFPNPAVSGGSGRASAAAAAAAAEEEELLSEYIPKLPTAHLGGAIEAEEMGDDEAAIYEQALESALDGAGADVEIQEVADVDNDAEEEDAADTKSVAVTGSANADAAKTEVHVNKLEPNYSSMSVKELRSLAQNRGISGVAKMSRKEIVEALTKKDSGVVEGVHSTAATSFGTSLTDNAAEIDA